MRFTSYAAGAIALMQLVAAAPHGEPSTQVEPSAHVEKRYTEAICAIICSGACAAAPITCLACVAGCILTAVPGEEIDVNQLKADVDAAVAEAANLIDSSGLQQEA
ncbi:uncharacterized protein CTRU02_214067 [Colletotrichum truncatum]|uniref:Uncharacterized protein n=1 Tax=Colletotrichum truncatum TaxID=5467 RepID=A0ACC3YHL2_COLTU|nr:uncharacterized protein CTRU02_06379 [Colletotrichum truncatum]KAF6792883.1 hypothetical protein CTRU02_06379 [Colletotrichum truncatum]